MSRKNQSDPRGPQNGKQVKPEDKCSWCGKEVGMQGARTSIPGFPYCPPDQNKNTRGK